MNFNIRMGIPEMQELWLDLQEKYRSGNIKRRKNSCIKMGKGFKAAIGRSRVSKSSNP